MDAWSVTKNTPKNDHFQGCEKETLPESPMLGDQSPNAVFRIFWLDEPLDEAG
jgi:hypothetical protein